MKLLAKYNRVNVAATIIVLLLSSIIYYFFIEAALVHQLDKSLVVEEREISDYVKENRQLPEPSADKDEQETFTASNAKIKRNFSSIKLFDSIHNEQVLYRQLEFPINVKTTSYKIEIRKSQEETEDLVQLILKITLVIVLILFSTLFIINRFVLNKLWKPFNSTLEKIKRFNISETNGVTLEPTNINEFTELNDAVSAMTKKASHDYDEIKTFTENASHELQTPLAIISSKLELLSQSENLKEEQMNIIQTISETTTRLSRLNQSLILLAKIDNQQFKETEHVDISFVIEHFINNYEELIHAKEITLTRIIKPQVILTMNETLAEILIINLFTNAIKHNNRDGKINIELTEKSLLVSNTGSAPKADPSVYFGRFKKDSDSGESLGLGLSIVLKICETYNFNITYKYEEKLHKMKINFHSA